MSKRFLSFLAFCLVTVSMAFAQTKVTGTVMDVETGEPVVGASVIVKGSDGLGAATDINGKFTIQNVPGTAKLLTVSHQHVGPTFCTYVIFFNGTDKKQIDWKKNNI